MTRGRWAPACGCRICHRLRFGDLESDRQRQVVRILDPMGCTVICAAWWFGTMEFYDFPHLGNVIIPTDELIFSGGVGQPPTSVCFYMI